MHTARLGSLVYVRRFRRPARLVGMLYLAVGLSLCVGLWLAPWGAMQSAARAMAMAAGLLCTLLGVTLLLGRAGREIDSTSGTASRWWGLGVPLVRRSQTLTEITSVAAVAEEGASAYAVYLINVAGEAWEFLRSRDVDVARQVAAETAAFLGRPWFDQTCLQPHTTPAPETLGAEEAATAPPPTDLHQ